MYHYQLTIMHSTPLHRILSFVLSAYIKRKRCVGEAEVKMFPKWCIDDRQLMSKGNGQFTTYVQIRWSFGQLITEEVKHKLNASCLPWLQKIKMHSILRKLHFFYSDKIPVSKTNLSQIIVNPLQINFSEASEDLLHFKW